MKNIILKIIDRTLLSPVKVQHSSQTIYEVLLGTLRLWEATKDDRWKARAEKLCNLLIGIQQPDGGFDIGYEFNFGKLHRVGESTSPELISLIALVEYYKIFGGNEVAIAAQKAAKWIKVNAINKGGGKWAIPYAPYSISDVMVYNGTSFAASALGIYLSEFKNEELEIIYHGMNKYLHDVMSCSDLEPGKYWHYSDQTRNNLSLFARNKIDYYHQMQQVECHAMAELVFPSSYQLEIINFAADNVSAKQSSTGFIPYYNTPTDVHLWGFCSCASGFIMAAKFNDKRKDEYRERAQRVINWIMKYSWNGEYFYPVVTKTGSIKDNRFYVRSDAWVFNTLALSIKEGVVGESFLEYCEINYRRMDVANFSGIENHASNKRIRLIKNAIGYTSKLVRRWLK